VSSARTPDDQVSDAMLIGATAPPVMVSAEALTAPPVMVSAASSNHANATTIATASAGVEPEARDVQTVVVLAENSPRLNVCSMSSDLFARIIATLRSLKPSPQKTSTLARAMS
jgi:hypothetical protein